MIPLPKGLGCIKLVKLLNPLWGFLGDPNLGTRWSWSRLLVYPGGCPNGHFGDCGLGLAQGNMTLAWCSGKIKL